jgi:hypothetical protein
MKLFKTNSKSTIDASVNLRNFRFLGEEAEILGGRLDAARKSLASSQTPWAQWYWTEAVDRLLQQWHAMPILHDADATMSIVPRWNIEYDFVEYDYSTGHDFTDRVFEKIKSDNADLNRSWEMVRAERLAKCQC